MEAAKVNVLVAEVHLHSARVGMAAVHAVVAGADPQAGAGAPQAEKAPHVFQAGVGGEQTPKYEGASSVTAPQTATLGASMLLRHAPSDVTRRRVF